MKKIIDYIAEELADAFEKAGYDRAYGKVTLSNRPDLCEYQCNGAMAGAKAYKKAPFMIAEDVVALLKDSACMEEVEVVKPGFINIRLKKAFVADYLNQMEEAEDLGIQKAENPEMIVVDYGGPNVAKPLHVGHLRSAIIGESVKRIARKMGHEVLGDIHLGDWGYQMGLIITELKKRKPELPYFDESFEGEYPEEAPFTISELEEIYPTASAYAKEHDDYREEALHATYLLQNGYKGYRAIWNHIINVSVSDLKRNYANLNVSFDLWKGESDAQAYIPDMIDKLKKDGFAHEDQGALVIDVQEETDTKEIPPCMIQKSDGASLYGTTDLATLVQRVEDYHPDKVIYVVDKRQELHFTQVFRSAKKTGIVPAETELKFLGFGTMNGKDGKPFKTREGGVMRLEKLIADMDLEMNMKVRNLSSGMMAKLKIAVTLSRKSELYLLDEPENSLSPARQLELARFLHDSARFYNCQFVIATHSPFLLAMPGARIYDLDSEPIATKRWTELENVRATWEFFQSHKDEFK